MSFTQREDAKGLLVVLEPGYEDYSLERQLLEPLGIELEAHAWYPDPTAIPALVQDADIVMVREAPLNAQAITSMTRCKGIVRYGSGVDAIDLEAARKRQIPVANTPDYGSDSVSDHAAALLLAISRRLLSRDRAVRRGAWDIAEAEEIHGLHTRRLGLIGYGRIAQKLHRKMRGFGPSECLVYDPYMDAGFLEEKGVRPVTLDDLCRQADMISLHLPLTEETHHLINAQRLSLMKPSTVIVNTARGGLIDEAALTEALSTGRLMGAGLDVMEEEPISPDHPLMALENVILTDHCGWYSTSAIENLHRMASEEAIRLLRREKPLNWVNPWE